MVGGHDSLAPRSLCTERFSAPTVLALQPERLSLEQLSLEQLALERLALERLALVNGWPPL